jgi:hypothetical protein
MSAGYNSQQVIRMTHPAQTVGAPVFRSIFLRHAHVLMLTGVDIAQCLNLSVAAKVNKTPRTKTSPVAYL